MTHHVLLIEDNEQNRYLVTFLLEGSGYQVTSAATGPDGIELARSGVFDLVLLDIQLPAMDGYAVAAALKADARTCGVPIVAVTSHAMVGDREKALASGAEGYIEKPIDPDTFVGEIERFIPSRGMP
jgi:two-component system cell cycle response regulator DivK